VGTHALFQAGVEFRDLRLAVVDEQHRFGVAQRMELGRRGDAADVLVMTATPIPRSLALTQYGDMDLSVLDEKPPGRKTISTGPRVDRADRGGRRVAAPGLGGGAAGLLGRARLWKSRTP
jgi:ATP-dependent DNA helicase RecG